MRKILFAILLVLMWAGSVGGATVYTKGISGVVYYQSGAASCDDITVGDTAGDLEAALSAAGSGGTLNICEGTYSGTMVDASDGLDTTHNSQTIIGIGNVILDGTDIANDLMSIRNTNCLLDNITVQNSSTGKYNLTFESTSEGSIAKNINILNGYSLVAFYNCTTAKLENSILSGGSYTAPINMYGSSSNHVIGINGCIFKGPGTFLTSKGISLTINNSIFIGSIKEALKITNNMTVNINNSIFTGNTVGSYHVIDNTGGGTTTVKNCILLNAPPLYSSYGYNNVTDGGNNSYISPLYLHAKYPYYITINIDDSGNFDHWKAIADYAESKGMKTSFSVSTSYLDAEQWTTLSNYISKGHAVISHGIYHMDLDDLDAFSIQYTGAGSTATMSIDYNTHRLITSIDAVQDLNLDLSSASYDTVSELTTYINSLGDYSCDVVTIDYPTDWLSDTSNVNIKTSYAVQLDTSVDSTPATKRFWDGEAGWAKIVIESNIPGYICKLFNYPYGISATYKSEIESALLEYGYLGSLTGNQRSISNIDVFYMNIASCSSYIGTSDIEKQVYAWIESAKQFGYIVPFMGHSSVDYSLSDWETIIDAISEMNETVTTWNDVIDDIINNSNTSDNITYTRTLTDESNPYPTNKAVWCAGTPVFAHGDGDQYAWTQDGGKELVWSDTTDAYTRCPAIGAFINPKEVPVSITHE